MSLLKMRRDCAWIEGVAELRDKKISSGILGPRRVNGGSNLAYSSVLEELER
jgi:hypothetical protein